MRKAVIDLDWLDENIAEYKRVLNEDLVGSELGSIYNHILNAFVLVRSKCEPIEDVKTLSVIGKANEKYSGLLYGEPKELPTKCLLDWESAKYCHNDNACELCKTK